MALFVDLTIDELQGRPCSDQDLVALRTWAQSRIHWSAKILQAVIRQKGYLLEIDAAPFSHPQWYGVDFEDVKLTARLTQLVFSEQG
jgi:hypothetical protein